VFEFKKRRQIYFGREINFLLIFIKEIVSYKHGHEKSLNRDNSNMNELVYWKNAVFINSLQSQLFCHKKTVVWISKKTDKFLLTNKIPEPSKVFRKRNKECMFRLTELEALAHGIVTVHKRIYVVVLKKLFSLFAHFGQMIDICVQDHGIIFEV